MNKYYTSEPDVDIYFVNISDLTESQIKYISDNIWDDIKDEPYEEAGYTFKYAMYFPFGLYYSEIHKFDELVEYLDNEGFEYLDF